MSGYLYRGRPGLEEINAQIMAERARNGTTERYQHGRMAGHGTDARAQRHRREGQKPCASCLAAERREKRRRDENRKAS